MYGLSKYFVQCLSTFVIMGIIKFKKLFICIIKFHEGIAKRSFTSIIFYLELLVRIRNSYSMIKHKKRYTSYIIMS